MRGNEDFELIKKLEDGIDCKIKHTLIYLTRFAVLLATSFADCTNCRLATGFSVFVDASLQALQRPAVCFAITVAADRIWNNDYKWKYIQIKTKIFKN